MLTKYFFRRFPYRFSSKFEEKQKDLRKESKIYFSKQNEEESLDSGHMSQPKVFKRLLLLLMAPSLYQLGGIIDPFQTSQHIQSLSMLFDNMTLYLSSMTGIVYYFSMVSKPDYSRLKQQLVDNITTSIPFMLFGMSATLFHEYQSIASFALLYPGMGLLIYGAQNVQTYYGVPANIFKFVMLSGAAIFVSSLIVQEYI